VASIVQLALVVALFPAVGHELGAQKRLVVRTILIARVTPILLAKHHGVAVLGANFVRVEVALLIALIVYGVVTSPRLFRIFAGAHVVPALGLHEALAL